MADQMADQMVDQMVEQMVEQMAEQMQRSWCLWVLRLKTETTYYYLSTTLGAGIVMYTICT